MARPFLFCERDTMSVENELRRDLQGTSDALKAERAKSEALLAMYWRLAQAAQAVCQSRNGSNPQATKIVHEQACDALAEALEDSP